MSNYREKYLKYKQKYLDQLGGMRETNFNGDDDKDLLNLVASNPKSVFDMDIPDPICEVYAFHPGRNGKDVIHSITTMLLPCAGMHKTADPIYSNDAFTIKYPNTDNTTINVYKTVTTTPSLDNDNDFEVNYINVGTKDKPINIKKNLKHEFTSDDDNKKYTDKSKRMLQKLGIYAIKLHDVKKFKIIDKVEVLCLVSVTKNQLMNTTIYGEKVYYGWTPCNNIHFALNIKNKKLLNGYISKFKDDFYFDPFIFELNRQGTQEQTKISKGAITQNSSQRTQIRAAVFLKSDSVISEYIDKDFYLKDGFNLGKIKLPINKDTEYGLMYRLNFINKSIYFDEEEDFYLYF